VSARVPEGALARFERADRGIRNVRSSALPDCAGPMGTTSDRSSYPEDWLHSVAIIHLTFRVLCQIT
jgi:hypothetical protein